MFTGASLVLSLLAPPAPLAPCDLVSKAAAGELLGAPVDAADPSGPEPDEDLPGATRSVCVYIAGSRMLLVMQHTFKDAASARSAMTQQAIRARHEEETGLSIKEEAGLGDKAYWVVMKAGGEYVVIKGAKVLSIAMGGAAKSPADFQPQLKAATAAALAKF